MPYISQEDRLYLNKFVNKYGQDRIQELAGDINSVPSGKIGGALNYVICRLTLRSQRPIGGWAYRSLSNAIGHIESAAAEIRRRLLDPYEDKCIEQNGDLKEFGE